MEKTRRITMADDILRFKDILEMDGKGPLEDPRPLFI
jgi:hypothetical protein